MASDGSPVRDAREKQKKKKKKADRSGTDRADVEETDAQLEIQRLTAAGHAALQRGDNNAALQSFRSAFKAATKLREKRLQRSCAFNLGAAYVEAGEPQKGLDVLSRTQPGERGERIADLQFNLATAHEALGDRTQAVRHYLQAAQLYRSQGDAAVEGDTCVRLAHCHLLGKEWDEAAASFQRAAESYKLAGNASAAALALKDAGKHMLQSGRSSSDDIISVLTDSLEMSSGISDQQTLGKLLSDVALSFSQMRLFSEASECYEQALPLVSSKPHRLAVVLQNLGAVYNSLGQYQQSLRYHREAAALHGSLGSRGAQGRCFSNLGFALVELGELEEAWESYLHAQQAFRDTDDPSGQWQACEGLGGIKLQMRDPDKAATYYKDALQLLCKCQDVSGSVQERLVSELSEALQQKLLLQQRGPTSQRTVPERHRNRRQPRTTAVRSDVQQWRREMPNGENAPHGKQHSQTITSSETHLRQEQEQAGHHNTLPEANRNLNNTYDKAEVNQQILPSESSGSAAHGDVCAESVKPKPVQMNGRHPLVRSTVTPPLTQPDSNEATPLMRRLKSRFCTVM
ncbi:tetratricopeptide repeat protein 24 isoform X3 [Onychostoma macrolepis]|uniref:tetratricopeptide repeat protein 24 isoform X3 n=1 Tax=Onychostoma macrolepis TaxID=369639 RepID=UPI00272C8858|nr:tetratricopeptide repeat protein 24 isoform X3 [Onychostoma macrolepis]